jgi:hypothetical protein
MINYCKKFLLFKFCKKILFVLIFLIFITLGFYVLVIYHRFGGNRAIKPFIINNLKCKKYLETARGPEDFSYSNKFKQIFISSYDRREDSGFGNIFYMETIGSGSGDLTLTNYNFEIFNPHGISILETEEKTLLYVINHVNSSYHTVDSFHYHHDTKTLDFKKRYHSDLFISPNDLIVISEEEYYITNDHDTNIALFKLFISLLFIQSSSIVHYKNGEYRFVQRGLRFGNGIEVLKNSTKLVVSQTLDFSIIEYDRNSTNGDLTYVRTIKLDFGVDNMIKVSNEGVEEIYVAGHPNLFSFFCMLIIKIK